MAERTHRTLLRSTCLALGSLLLGLATSGASCFNQSNANHPETLRHQLACKEYLEKQDLDAAETRCKLCLEYDRNNPECLNMMGQVWYLRGSNDQARDWYKRAMRARNDFPEARNNMGVIFMEQDADYKEAATMFASAIKIDPGYQDARWNLALAYSKLGTVEFAEAQQKLDKKGANKVDPQVLKATFADAEDYYGKADDQLRRVFELNPKHFKAYGLMGFIELQRAAYAPTQNVQRRNFERSQDMSMRCVELAPVDKPEAVQCRGNLGYVLEQLGQCDQAMLHWMSCLALAPKEPECQRGLNRAYTCDITRSGALKKYIEQVSGNPGYAPGHFNLCVAAFEANLPDIGAASCENAIQLDKNLCLAHYQLGKHYRNVLNQEKAIGYCKSFISCTGTQNPAEIQECKDLIAALEVQ
ncbi:MAG: tetratricopeptide repeat protein [Myxococcota bacterium]